MANQSVASKWDRDSRDLLIELRTQMSAVRTDINTINENIKSIDSGISNRVLNLESNAVSKLEIKGMQNTIDDINKWRYIQYGAVAGVASIITLVVNLISGTIHI